MAWFKEGTGTDSVSDNYPSHYHLYHNYPNPFNSTTVIAYTIPVERQKTKDERREGPFDPRGSTLVSLTVYNVLGQVVRVLVEEEQEAGSYMVSWDGTYSDGLPAASGVYFCRLKSGTFTATRRMVPTK